MPVSTGRNSLLENVYRQINKLFNSKVEGSQRSISRGYNGFSSVDRDFDLEIAENPIRDAGTARKLIEICTYCPEIVTALERINGDIFSSADGDDLGFKIDDILDDESPIDPQVKEILDNLIENVLGGLTMQAPVERMLSYGDAFISIGIGKTEDGLGITKVLTLPTWELFRKEDDQGRLLGFEQRKDLTDKEPAFKFHPAQIVHLRHKKNYLYGRPIFGKEVFADWLRLKRATEALDKATVEVGVNPNVHLMPESADSNYKDAYKADYENTSRMGVVSNLYLMPGADVKKLSTTDTDLSSLINTVLLWRSRIIMRSQLPLWMFSGMTTVGNGGAKEISEQPSLAYARQINHYRMCLSEGLKQLCLTELILKGIPEERRSFRLVHPKIYVSTNQQLEPEDTEDPTDPNQAGKSNSTKPKVKPKPKTKAATNGDSLDWLETMDQDALVKQFGDEPAF